MPQPLVVNGSAAYPSPSDRPVVTIGNFDGVHRGHRALIQRAIALARERCVPACVYTFDPAPRDVLRPGNAVPRIQTLDQKVALLGELGIARVVVEPFTRAFGAHGGEWFAREVLTQRIAASAVVVGWDFRFGKGRSGTVDALAEWMDVPVEQVSALQDGGEVVSSSRIREALCAGDVASAATWLERPHTVTGQVIRGDARGRTLGIRTANLGDVRGLVPADGVYAVRVTLPDGTHARAVANIGSRPTFQEASASIEVHVLDHDVSLYGQRIEVRWIDRLRDEKRFDNGSALVAQIQRDIAAARERLA